NRGEKDKNVGLTALISKGEAQDTKEIPVTVKAQSDITEEDFEAYVFAYFKGEGSATGEQIYFATSEDGLHWKDMNDGEPVLKSELGEKGLRDPFIIRSPEGDKFYLIATDLKINGGNGWGAAQTAGSQSIMVWESTDMVNWSNQRMAKVALDDAGCTWAPEAFYDEKTGEYIVFWASKTSADNYGVQRVYYSKTRDFYSFTEPELWIELHNQEGNAISVIDTSVISVMENGKKVYYRFSKNEAGEDHDVKGGTGKYTIVEKSNSLIGGWTEVTSLKDQRYVEGGTCFKFNGEDKWCLLLDDFGGVGYYPMITTDLGSGAFTRLDSSKYSFPSTMRHGTVMSLTRQEYDAIQKKWYDEASVNTEEEEENAVLKYSFEDAAGSNTIKDDSGKGRDGKIYGNAAYVEDQVKGNVLYLNGTKGTYAELPQGFFDGRNKMTISMDVKAEMVDGDFFTFGIGKNSNRYLLLKTQNTQSRVSITTGSYGSEQTASGTTSAIKGKWMNITMVVTPDKITVYKDGKLLGEQKVTVKMAELGTNLFAYLGRSLYSKDNYFKGYFDNIEVYNRAMEAKEVADKYGEKPAAEKFTITYKAGEHGKIKGTATQILEKGTVGTKVEAVADSGYEFSKWSDGSTQAARTDLAEKDVTYTAYFVKTQVTPPTDAPETETPPTEKPSQPSTEKPSQPSTEKPSQPSTEKPKPATPAAKSVKINKRKITIGLKEKVTLKATVYPKGASQKVTWSSSKKSVVKVNSKGQIEGKKTGKATITVKTANKKSYKCTVTVRKAPSKISLNTKDRKLKVGKSFQLKVNLPSKTASYNIRYSSTRKSVAVVSSTGKITAKKKGTTTIKVKAFNGKYKKIKIKVVKK
ncbi:MAG: Ig-like domain-containing protein, partial [Proteus hauseri]|nr:Ig-like domain-containing protein [Proteus hauseri]